MDDELAAIRAARLQELQRNTGSGAGPQSGGNGSGGNNNAETNPSLLAQVLEPQARERLSRVRMVKPERAQAVEQYLLKLVQMGQLRHKLSETELVQILDGLSRDSSGASKAKIIFDRKQVADDDDEEDEDDFFD